MSLIKFENLRLLLAQNEKLQFFQSRRLILAYIGSKIEKYPLNPLKHYDDVNQFYGKQMRKWHL